MSNREFRDNTAYFAANAKRKQATQDERERQTALARAGEIYNDWQKRVVIQSRRLEELPELLNLLAWDLDREITHADLKKNLLQLVNTKLADVFGRVEMEKRIIRLYGDCPNYRAKKIGTDSDDAPNSIECGWGGEIVMMKEAWEAGTIEFNCPQCGNKIGKKDMIEPQDVPAARQNRFIRYRPGKKLNPKKDVFPFTTTEQLLELSFLNVQTAVKGFERFAIDGRNLMVIVNGRANRVGQIEFPEAVNIGPLETTAGAPAQPIGSNPAPQTPSTDAPTPAPAESSPGKRAD